jgi:hypothetical protein
MTSADDENPEKNVISPVETARCDIIEESIIDCRALRLLRYEATVPRGASPDRRFSV